MVKRNMAPIDSQQFILQTLALLFYHNPLPAINLSNLILKISKLEEETTSPLKLFQ